jgi:hypothetical protein
MAGELYRRFLDTASRMRSVHKWHHYFDIYERHFARYRGRPMTLFEFGVFKGGSLELWKSYFGHAARIIGLDLNPDCAAYAGPGIDIRIGDQADRNFLRQVLAEFGPPDIVIDDGGHSMNQQITTFEVIYPAMSTSGIYLVEDTHTTFWGGEFDDRADGKTFLSFAFDRCQDLHGWTRDRAQFERFGRPPGERTGPAPDVSDFCRSTGSISFYDSVVVFERRARPEPWHEMR